VSLSRTDVEGIVPLLAFGSNGGPCEHGVRFGWSFFSFAQVGTLDFGYPIVALDMFGIRSI